MISEVRRDSPNRPWPRIVTTRPCMDVNRRHRPPLLGPYVVGPTGEDANSVASGLLIWLIRFS
jgi:hypothetical protein